jgi:C-terminal processing protease CtpA/Prc
MSKMFSHTSLILAVIVVGLSAGQATAGKPGSYRPAVQQQTVTDNSQSVSQKFPRQQFTRQQHAVQSARWSVPPTSSPQQRTDTEREIPRLGVFYKVVDGVGMRVVSVERGSAAEQLELQAGDLILSVNGDRLLRSGDWERTLRNTMNRGHKLVLSIFDNRTATVANRTAMLVR